MGAEYSDIYETLKDEADDYTAVKTKMDDYLCPNITAILKDTFSDRKLRKKVSAKY